jgi:hypothetical protein
MATYRVRADWTGTPVNGPTVSTFHFDASDGTAQAASDNVATFLAALDANLSTTLTWTTEPEVDTLNTSTGTLEAVTAVTTATGTGGNADNPLPTSTQGLARWTTGVIVSGRALKGHMFIPGFCENNNTDGAPGAATITGVNTILGNFEDAISPQLVVWSRTHGVQHPVLGSSMWNKWAILRSRRD